MAASHIRGAAVGMLAWAALGPAVAQTSLYAPSPKPADAAGPTPSNTSAAPVATSAPQNLTAPRAMQPPAKVPAAPTPLYDAAAGTPTPLGVAPPAPVATQPQPGAGASAAVAPTPLYRPPPTSPVLPTTAGVGQSDAAVPQVTTATPAKAAGGTAVAQKPPAAAAMQAAGGPTSLAYSSPSDNAPPSPAQPVKHQVAKPGRASAKGVLVIATQHPSWGRVSFVLHGNPAPEVRPVPDGVEVHLPAGVRLEISGSAHLRETGPISVRDDGGAQVATIHLNCHCVLDQAAEGGILRFDVRPGTPAADVAKVENQTKTEVASEGAAAKTRTGISETGAAPEAAKPPTPPAKPEAETVTPQFAKSGRGPEPRDGGKLPQAAEMARLRAFLTEKLAQLNGAAPVTQATPAAGNPGGPIGAIRPVERPSVVSDAAASRAPPPIQQQPATADTGQSQQAQAGPCLDRVDASAWRGTGAFTDRLAAVRTAVARSHSSAASVAGLAEFYLANGFGHEAEAAAAEAGPEDAAPKTRLRLVRDADIARLVDGETLTPDSPLISNPPGCARPDAVLWRDLAAAAAGDGEGAARDPETAAAALRLLPEALQRELAFRIVDAVGDNLDALRAMAGAMRNANASLPEDEARRFLLQARIAGLTGDKAEYAVFLDRAAQFDMTPPGIIAKAKLAAIRAAEPGPEAAHSEAVLIDIARTYRHDVLGQEAAEQYAELRLRRHDYAAALAIADESAGPRGQQPRESRGASLALRILRMLFVDPATADLPSADERIALYLRYGAYVTPGEKGDDIRLAAARLMLDHSMADAALEPLGQLSETSAATPDARQMLATAQAYGGDPAKALELVQALPDDIVAHRIAAEALRRKRQPLQAAHLLDGAASIADKQRRAGLLFEGEAWQDAADAYAGLLRDPLLQVSQRNDIATRYALSVAMTGQPATAAPAKLPDGPTAVLAAVPTPSAAETNLPPSLTKLRGALERARHVETMLDAHQGS